MIERFLVPTTVGVQYGNTRKLGNDATYGEIKDSGDNRFSIIISEFIFIGYDDLMFETVAEDKGSISFRTEDTDAASVITENMIPESFIS